VGRRSREELFWLCCGPYLYLKLLQQHFQSAAQSTFLLDFFPFLHFPLFFTKIYGLRKYLQNCTSIAMGDGGRDLPPCPTAAGARGTVAPTTAVGYGGKGSVYFQKFIVFFV
jgi:hypothetical protein